MQDLFDHMQMGRYFSGFTHRIFSICKLGEAFFLGTKNQISASWKAKDTEGQMTGPVEKTAKISVLP